MSLNYTFTTTFKNKQKASRKPIYRLLTQDTRIIFPKCKGIDSSLSLDTNSREKRGIFIIITGLAGLAYEGISAYLNWRKSKVFEKGYKAMQSHQT